MYFKCVARGRIQRGNNLKTSQNGYLPQSHVLQKQQTPKSVCVCVCRPRIKVGCSVLYLRCWCSKPIDSFNTDCDHFLLCDTGNKPPGKKTYFFFYVYSSYWRIYAIEDTCQATKRYNECVLRRNTGYYIDHTVG